MTRKSTERKALVEMEAYEFWKTRLVEEVGAKALAEEVGVSLSLVHEYGREPQCRSREAAYSPVEAALSRLRRVTDACERMGRYDLKRATADFVRLDLIRRGQVRRVEPPATLLRARAEVIEACGRFLAAAAPGDDPAEMYHYERLLAALGRYYERRSGYEGVAPPLRAVV